MLTLFFLILIFLPYFLVPEIDLLTIQWAFSIIFLGTLISSIKLFAGASLYGSNLTYKGMGVMAVTGIAGGILSIVLVKNDFGLIGVSIGSTLGLFAGCIISFYMAAKYVAWFGVARCSRVEFSATFKSSFLFMVWSLIEVGLLTTDVLLLGFYASPDHVSKYVITGYTVQMVTALVLTFVMASLPGIGVFISAGNKPRALEILKEGTSYALLLGFTIGATVFICNQSFVYLWVGETEFAGSLEQFLIVIVVLQIMMIRSEAAVINLCLNIREKIKLGFLSLLLTAVLAYQLVPMYGVVGICLSLIVGRLVLSIKYPRIVSRFLKGNDKKIAEKNTFIRIYMVGVVVLAFAFVLGRDVIITSWLNLGLLAVFVFIVALMTMFIAGLSKELRLSVSTRINTLFRK